MSPTAAQVDTVVAQVVERLGRSTVSSCGLAKVEVEPFEDTPLSGIERVRGASVTSASRTRMRAYTLSSSASDAAGHQLGVAQRAWVQPAGLRSCGAVKEAVARSPSRGAAGRCGNDRKRSTPVTNPISSTSGRGQPRASCHGARRSLARPRGRLRARHRPERGLPRERRSLHHHHRSPPWSMVARRAL